MIKHMIFFTIGGLGLFLFGMELMADGLKRTTGRKTRKLLSTLTSNPIMGVLVGAFTTCIIQSSSATSVILIGFVNASLMTLKQALGVIMGANIGTTITAWLVSSAAVLDITSYSLPAIAVGFALRMLGRTDRTRNIGNIILGFGILFEGIDFMSNGFTPLQDNPRVHEIIARLGRNPALAVLIGLGLTMLIQSSSASIAMLQILAFKGAMGSDWHIILQLAIGFVLGSNIGTTITAQIAAIRTSLAARRTAWGHTLFNVGGVLYILPLLWLGWYTSAVEWITPFKPSASTIMVHIAVAHSMFNILNTLIFLPFINQFEALIVKLLPATAADAMAKPIILEEHLLNTPELAIDQARRAIVRMVEVAKTAVNQATAGLDENDTKKLQLAREAETASDNYQYEITSYLAMLSTKELSAEISVQLPVLLHTVNDLERIGDHAVNIAEIAERKIEQKISFSNSAQTEAARMIREVNQMFGCVSISLEKNDTEMAKSALVNEDNLNRMQLDYRRNHVQRMTEGACSPVSGLIFIDLVDNMEKIGDHLTNIAQSVIGGLQWDGVEAKTAPRHDH